MGLEMKDKKKINIANLMSRSYVTFAEMCQGVFVFWQGKLI
jgi:hypothetical protein